MIEFRYLSEGHLSEEAESGRLREVDRLRAYDRDGVERADLLNQLHALLQLVGRLEVMQRSRRGRVNSWSMKKS